MANIGLSYVVAAKYGEGGAYTEPRELAQAISANIQIATYDDKLYANDGIREAEKGFKEGSMALNIDDLSPDAYAFVTGALSQPANIEGETDVQEIISRGIDNPPDVGVGFYASKLVGGVRSYRAIWLTKVKFAAPSEELATKGENISYGTPTINGTIQLNEQGIWKNEVTVSTVEAAKAWLNGKAGLTV